MSRSSKKYTTFYTQELILYFNKILNLKKNYIKTNLNRKKTLNSWNLQKVLAIHQGRYTSKHILCDFFLNLKVGSLSKTRKPFFFRSKKKR